MLCLTYVSTVLNLCLNFWLKLGMFRLSSIYKCFWTGEFQSKKCIRSICKVETQVEHLESGIFHWHDRNWQIRMPTYKTVN